MLYPWAEHAFSGVNTPGCELSQGTRLEPFVVTSVVQLLCRTTKLCWYDDDAFRNIVEDAKRFLDKVSSRGPNLHAGPVLPWTPAGIPDFSPVIASAGSDR